MSSLMPGNYGGPPNVGQPHAEPDGDEIPGSAAEQSPAASGPELVVKENVSIDPSRTVDPSYIDPVNYAADEECVTHAKEKILPLIQRTRSQRMGWEQFIQRMYMVWAAQNDNNTRLYSGMSDQYLPSVNVATKTLIGHVKAEVFPPGAPLAIVPSPLDPFAQQAAPIVQLLLQHSAVQADIVGNFRNAAWQTYIMGCSPQKTVWKTVQMKGYKPQIVGLDPLSGMPQVQMMPHDVTLYEGPTFTPVNILRWYIYPFNVQDIKDARAVFEDHRRGVEEFKAAGEPGPNGAEPQWYNVAAALEKRPRTTSDVTQTQGFLDARTALFGMFETQISDDDVVMTTEIYCLHDIHCDGRMIPCKITTCGQEILEIRQTPFIDPSPPYVTLRFEDVLEHFYGRSKVQNVEAINLAQNAAFNQGIDANMFAGNPLTGINALMFQGRTEDLEITPLGIYAFNGEPQKAMTFYQIPNTLEPNLRLVSELQDILEKSMQASPALSGEVPDREGISATATNAAVQGAMAGVSEDAFIVKQMLKRWVHKAWKLNQQFLSTQASINLTKMPMFNIDPSVLVGEYEFDVLTGQEAQMAIQAQQAQMAQAQMMQLQAAGRKGAQVSAKQPEGLGQNNQPGGSNFPQVGDNNPQ